MGQSKIDLDVDTRTTGTSGGTYALLGADPCPTVASVQAPTAIPGSMGIQVCLFLGRSGRGMNSGFLAEACFTRFSDPTLFPVLGVA